MSNNEKKITLSFDLGQVANDILTKCNLISKAIKEEALEDIRASVQEPDGPETHSIINRSVTEAFGNVKVACQRYLHVGRLTDDNDLEQMVAAVTYVEGPVTRQVVTNGHPVWIGKVSGTDTEIYIDSSSDSWKKISDNTAVTLDPNTTPVKKTETVVGPTGEIDSITYETVTLELFIPNFNTSVTDALKSQVHKYVVDYTMGRFLQDLVTDKAEEYGTLAEDKDYPRIVRLLNARESFHSRKPTWI